VKVVGTHDEITYIMLQCQKRGTCEGCVLEIFCNKDRNIFKRLNPFKLRAFETDQFEPKLIAKGDDDSGNKIQ
jgi:hypothetical protein